MRIERKHAFGSEILQHTQAIARSLDLYAHATFPTAVTGMR
jgi:hypothetical protein